jgi:hypothetical protein
LKGKTKFGIDLACLKKKKIMKALNISFILALALLIVGCNSQSGLGTKVKEPFSGSKYESNNKYFRGVGSAKSVKDNIARSKADLEAKRQLAGQVNTTMKNVTDQYLGQTENANAADVADKFQSLTREVMNTEIADLRKIGEEKYTDGTNYTVYVAYEIKKNAMFRFMKKQAKTDAKIDKVTLKTIEDILDEQISQTEE